MFHPRILRVLCFALSLGSPAAHASRTPLPPVPAEIASSHFIVTINGQATPVMHAALNLYFLNFDAHKHCTIAVTADSDTFWAGGVEVQPWRLNIRPTRSGRTITFRLDGPAKISISRPGDFFSDSEMLYLFANPAEKNPPTATTPGIRFFGPGIHRENIDAATGDHIYLAPGSVILGSLNIWQVDRVSVLGRGVIVYDGPQNPADDDGWMHKRNWHCIVMDNAHDITIEGLTCVVRSRTWQIQMKDSRRIVYDNIKVIGANTGNANADGMDWLGGGDTVVRNSFFRAADDVFAMQSSWEGYGPTAFAVQGEPVTNVTVEHSVLSTSISNIVRAAWPGKNFEGGNFLMRDTDVLHMGLGGCGIPFALMELWADPHGRGQSAGFHFANIRMEDWYSLLHFQQPTDGVHDITFTDVMGLEYPSLVPSTLKGQITGVSLDNTVLAGVPMQLASDVPVVAGAGALPPLVRDTGPQVRVIIRESLLHPGQRVHFTAERSTANGPEPQYRWTFGDGAQATGRSVSHKFRDAEGTLLDGSGRFRVLLQATADGDRHTWVYAPAIVSAALHPATSTAAGTPGLAYTYRGDDDTQTSTQGISLAGTLSDVPRGHRNYTLTLDGQLNVPGDGGYSFLLIANEKASLDIDGQRLAASLAPIPQVCGLEGMAARPLSASIALARGFHHLHITESHTAGEDNFRVLWQGPGFSLRPLDPDHLSHTPQGTSDN